MPINNSYRNKANRILDECIIRNNYDNNNNNKLKVSSVCDI